MRKTTNSMLDALLQSVQQAGNKQPISWDVLHSIVEHLKTSQTFDHFYRHAYEQLVEEIKEEELEQKRVYAFGRLMIHPLAPLLRAGTFDRCMLPNVFSFFHLVLGDDADAFNGHCLEVLARLRDELGDDFTWESFYDDADAKLVQWRTLVRIAESFKRWDVRKDWFLNLMQYTPTTISTAQNAFVVKEHAAEERAEPRVFTNHEFCIFFQALFAPLTEIGPQDEARFRAQFGADPHHKIGAFLMNLAACPV
jgi:hypothetical protein